MPSKKQMISSIARKEAIKNGHISYISTKPCNICGSLEKYVSAMSCYPCGKNRGLKKLFDESLMKEYRTKAKQNAKTYRYRSRKRNQMPNDADHEKILKFYEEATRLTKETGIIYSVDHIIPLSRGGLHHQDNLQVITLSENSKKGNKICPPSF